MIYSLPLPCREPQRLRSISPVQPLTVYGAPDHFINIGVFSGPSGAGSSGPRSVFILGPARFPEPFRPSGPAVLCQRAVLCLRSVRAPVRFLLIPGENSARPAALAVHRSVSCLQAGRPARGSFPEKKRSGAAVLPTLFLLPASDADSYPIPGTSAGVLCAVCALAFLPAAAQRPLRACLFYHKAEP